MTSEKFPLDRILLSFIDKDGYTDITYADLFRNVLLMGSTGAGKTTTSGALIAKKALEQGCGFLVMCVKDSEAQRFIDYCKHTGRSKDVLHIRPGHFHFDFLQYESRPRHDGKTITANVVSILKGVINAENQSKDHSNNEYWSNALDEVLNNCVDMCLLSAGSVTVDQMYQIISTAPRSNTTGLNENLDQQFISLMRAAKLQVDSEVFRYVDDLPREHKERLKDPVTFDREIQSRFESVRILNRINQFFFHSYKLLSTRTRGIIESSFSGLLFRLLQEPLYSLFCSGKTNFVPEDVLKGKIIILDIPVLTYGKAGESCQRLFKSIFQSAMQRRNLKENSLPVVIWQDEAYLTLVENDSNFLSTCREKRVANIMIAQNLSNFYFNMGGDKSDHRVNSLLSGLATKLIHANDHLETNEMMSRLIGEAYTDEYSYNDSISEKFSSSRSQSYKKERMVPPEAFLDLQSPTKANGGISEAYVILQGKSFHSGFHHQKITFKQVFLNNLKLKIMSTKNLYFRATYRRVNVITSFLFDIFKKLSSYPRLTIEVFSRKDFGHRYYRLSSALSVLFLLVVIPIIVHHLPSFTDDYRAPENFWFKYATWYLYTIAYAYFAFKRWLEIKHNPSTFDFTKFSLYSGTINETFFQAFHFWQTDNSAN